MNVTRAKELRGCAECFYTDITDCIRDVTFEVKMGDPQLRHGDFVLCKKHLELLSLKILNVLAEYRMERSNLVKK